MDQVLRDEGFETGKVVEQEYIALFNGRVLAFLVLMQLDIELQQLFRGTKRLYAKVVNPGVYLRVAELFDHQAGISNGHA